MQIAAPPDRQRISPIDIEGQNVSKPDKWYNSPYNQKLTKKKKKKKNNRNFMMKLLGSAMQEKVDYFKSTMD